MSRGLLVVPQNAMWPPWGRLRNHRGPVVIV